MQGTVGVVAFHVFGAQDAQIAQAQPLGQFLLVDQRFGKEHLRVDEDHRHGSVHHRGQMQQGHRIRPEAGHERQPRDLVPGVAEHIRRGVVP